MKQVSERNRYEDARAIFEIESARPTYEDPCLVGEAFERIEEDFDRFLDESLQPRGRDSLDDLLTHANPPRGGTALDVGCGHGRDVVALATRFGLHVHGVDPSPANVEHARRRAAAVGLQDQVDVCVGRAEDIPLPDVSVDVLWCKEAITFTDLDLATAEFRRVLRPGGVGVIYQVLTGPAMTAPESEWLTAQEMGFGPARSLRPDDVEHAIRAGGLDLIERLDYASEWGELGEENDGSAGRRLLHAARLIRSPQVYLERYGASNYRIMLADCLWHVYRMIGKLWGVAFLIKRP